MSSAQVMHWYAYEAVEGPLGPRGDWERTALLASIIANANRNTKRRPEPFSSRDFLPWIEKPKFTAAVFKAMFGERIVKRKGPK